MSEAVLILAILTFAYPFLLYPLVLACVSGKQRLQKSSGKLQQMPSVRMVICALNEQHIIRRKLENCLALEYPRDKLRIVVISDGSTDATAEIVREYLPRGIELIERRDRCGKAANLNGVLEGQQDEIIVFSDANVLYDTQALLRIVAPFEDPSVGCVSGKVVLQNTMKPLQASEKNYYAVEWYLQEKASDLYSMAGSDGALYALRRGLFCPCPDDTLLDDFVIAMGVVRQGKRIVFEPQAVGWEDGPAGLREEFRRKVRIAAGAAQALVRGNGWPRRAPLRFWFIFVSHKLLRWFSPFLGLLAVILALITWPDRLSQMILWGSLALTALAALRLLTRWDHPMLDRPFYFIFGQLALALGLLKGATGRQSVLWAKADR